MTDLVVEHDPVYWVLIDPLGDDMDSWATRMARERFPLEGREPAEGELELMAASLLRLAEQQSIRQSSNFLFAYTPLASLPLLLVDVLVLAASDGSETAMRDLTGADDTDLAEPADVTRVQTPLGVAVRSRRYYRQEGSTALLAVLTYGWHLPEHGVDVRLSTAGEDLAVLHAAEDDLHTLALACRVE